MTTLEGTPVEESAPEWKSQLRKISEEAEEKIGEAIARTAGMENPENRIGALRNQITAYKGRFELAHLKKEIPDIEASDIAHGLDDIEKIVGNYKDSGTDIPEEEMLSLIDSLKKLAE